MSEPMPQAAVPVKHRIMIVDDEPFVVRALATLLETQLRHDAVKVEAFTDPNAALARAAHIRYDVAISDYRMRPVDGIEFLKRLRQLQPRCVRLMLSATHEMATVVKAVNDAGVYKYIPKPWPRDVATLIRDAIERHDEQAEEQRLADERRREVGTLTDAELERRRLEAEEPGITRVRFAPDGSLRLEDL